VNLQPQETQRLQKLLAASGHGSRRQIEEWIRAGRLQVNGKTVTLGDRARACDEIRLDGRLLPVRTAEQATTIEVIGYHKPIGEVTTRRDPQDRPTVFQKLPQPASGRWVSIGRLDFMTSGLLLFTNDGELANRLMHPSSEVEREYLVRVRGSPTLSALGELGRGVELDGVLTRFDRVVPESSDGTHASFRCVLHEGRNREVRRLWSAAGHEISRLARIRYGPIELPRDLPAGRWRAVPKELVERLIEAAT
jgi:23S rRNA pseudouridine2605 synthase